MSTVPVELLVVPPSKFELIVNLEPAKVLGLTIAQSILAPTVIK